MIMQKRKKKENKKKRCNGVPQLSDTQYSVLNVNQNKIPEHFFRCGTHNSVLYLVHQSAAVLLYTVTTYSKMCAMVSESM